MSLTSDAASLIALRTRGTPRVANALLRRARDLAQIQRLRDIENDDSRPALMVRESTASEALALLRIDALGLGPIDRKILSALAESFGGRRVGDA